MNTNDSDTGAMEDMQMENALKQHPLEILEQSLRLIKKELEKNSE